MAALTCRWRACFSRRLMAFSLRSAFSCCSRDTALRSGGSRPTARRCSSVDRFWGPDTLGLLLYGSAACKRWCTLKTPMANEPYRAMSLFQHDPEG